MLKNIKSVVIGSSVYKIDHTRDCIVTAGEECYGAHDYEAREIRITTDESISIQQKEETLLHEIVHAINDDRDLELEEAHIRGISKGLYQALRDNKNIFDSFTFGL